MKLYRRVALGAIVFWVIGPLMIAASFTMLAVVVVSVHDGWGLGEVVSDWLGMFGLVGLIALYAGGIPAAVVGILVGAMATQVRRRYLYLCAVIGAVVPGLLFFAFVIDLNLDGAPVVFGTAFSIPVAASLTRLLLAIIRRSQNLNLEGEQVSGGRL